jgi:hypothetical protein
MDESLSSWLALREPADFAARSATLAEATARRLDAADPVRVVDLGTGTGSNLRYLIDRLSHHQEWLLVDRDQRLLNEVSDRMQTWAIARGYEVSREHDGLILGRKGRNCRIATRQMDLGVLASDEIFERRHLVTASALLDLVSVEWLRALANRCAEHRCAALFALSYNGESHAVPREPEDDEIRMLMNRHQRTDKGFAPAAGPDASAAAARAFEAVGYHVQRERTNWILGPELPDLQRQLIEGWAHAALEIAPERTGLIRDWLSRRLEHLRHGRSRIVVGHEDLAAWPRETSVQMTRETPPG